MKSVRLYGGPNFDKFVHIGKCEQTYAGRNQFNERYAPPRGGAYLLCARRKRDILSQETRLLVAHRMDTDEQLVLYRESLQAKMEALTNTRKGLYRAQHTAADKQTR